METVYSPWARNGVGYVTRAGYVMIFVEGRKEKIYEHQYVAEKSHGKIPKGHVAMHLNGNRRDNRPENIRIGTQAENIRHDLSGRRPAHIIINGRHHRYCRGCDEVLPVEAFHRRTPVVPLRPGEEPRRMPICIACVKYHRKHGHYPVEGAKREAA